MHSCKVDDATCCALCRRQKFYRRLRTTGLATDVACRISGQPPSGVKARLAMGHLTEYVGRA